MFKLIYLRQSLMAVVNTYKKVYWCGDNVDAMLNIMSDLGVDYNEVQMAIQDMKTTDTNCADFGINGTFIFSERKTMEEINAMIPEPKEKPAC